MNKKTKTIIILAIMLIAIIPIFLIIQNNKIKFKYEYTGLDDMFFGTDPTFKFTASSKHFAVQTGEAFYNDNDENFKKKYLHINNFKVIKGIKNLKSYSLDVRFYDILLMNNETHYQDKEDIKDFLAEAIISYSGRVPDPFYMSKEDEFKDNLKINIKYCLNNDKCYEEKLKIKYID